METLTSPPRQFPRWLLSVAIASGTIASIWQPLSAQESQKPVPEVPVLAPASKDAEDAIGTFKVPESLRCELFAAEPLLGNPVVFTFDRFGRIYVCESYRQNKGITDNRNHDGKWLDADLAAMTVADRVRYHRELLGAEAADYEKYDDLIRVIEDTDGDGKGDRQVVFASGFNAIEEGTGAGVLVRDDIVYFTNIPKLWGLRDTNGDLIADERIVLSDGYGIRVAFRGHDMHGLIIGPDGRLYYSIGDRGYHVETPDGTFKNPESGAVFRCELDGSNLEVVATGLRNPQELAFDDEGNLFTGDNNSDSGDKARWVQVVQGSDSGWRMMYQYLPDRGPFNREKIWHPYNIEESPAYIVPPIANIGDGPSGLLCYTGVGLEGGDEYKNAFFMCDFRGQPSNSGIRRIQLKPEGATFTVDKNEQFIWSILGTDIETAPDGSLFVSDWVNGWNGENKGRLYRFSSKSEEVKRIGVHSAETLKRGFSTLGVDELTHLLRSPDRRIRLEAQWELAKRNQTEALSRVLRSGTTRNEKLHAIWGLGQILRRQEDVTARATLLGALVSKDEYVVARACDALAEGKSDFPVGSLQQLLAHKSAVVKRQALLAIANTKAAILVDEIAKILIENRDRDPVLRHAAVMALSKIIDASSLPRWIKHPDESVRVAVAVALRHARNPAIAELLKDSSPRVVREAARAIYDVPELQSEMHLLAALTVAQEFDAPIVERILHANYRLGQTSNIDRLIQFAVSNVGTEEKRIEALQLLGEWGKPGLRDKIMNRHLPLEDRPTDAVVERLKKNVAALSATPSKVRDAFFKVGAKYEMTELASMLSEIAKETEADPLRRADAILALSHLKPEELTSVRDSLLGDKSVQVRIAALRAFTNIAPASMLDSISSRMASKETVERQAAWDLIAKLDSKEADTLLSKGAAALLDNTLPRDTWINAQEAIEAKGSSEQKDALKKRMDHQATLVESSPKEAYVDCIEGGDVDAGRELFFTRSSLSCVRCHKVGETGGEVGPSLSDIGKLKKANYLLEAIIAPNMAIAEGFETVVVLTEDDVTLSGILKSETDKTLSLMDAQGVVFEVDKDEIVSRKKGLSSMPADLQKFLSRRELRDLVAYLASLNGTPEAIRPLGQAGGHGL